MIAVCQKDRDVASLTLTLTMVCMQVVRSLSNTLFSLHIELFHSACDVTLFNGQFAGEPEVVRTDSSIRRF